jgi:hypothetical protein
MTVGGREGGVGGRWHSLVDVTEAALGWWVSRTVSAFALTTELG